MLHDFEKVADRRLVSQKGYVTLTLKRLRKEGALVFTNGAIILLFSLNSTICQ